jgi:hypothetical protein
VSSLRHDHSLNFEIRQFLVLVPVASLLAWALWPRTQHTMATPRALRVAVRPALSKHTATIIFMHGLGDSSAGWEFISDHFASLSHVKFLFPNAPNQPVSINMGMKMQVRLSPAECI